MQRYNIILFRDKFDADEYIGATEVERDDPDYLAVTFGDNHIELFNLTKYDRVKILAYDDGEE